MSVGSEVFDPSPVGRAAPIPEPMRPVMADPGAWAVLAFSTTSFMLGLYNAQLVDPNGLALVIPVAFVFGGVVQILVAVLEVIRGNLFGAAVFGSFGPFWIIYGLIEDRYSGKVATAAAAAKDPAAVTSAVTVFLVMFAVLTLLFLVASLRTDVVLVAILLLLLVALILLAAGVHQGNLGLQKTSGWLTLVFGILGWYHGGASVIEATFKRPILPLGTLARAA